MPDSYYSYSNDNDTRSNSSGISCDYMTNETRARCYDEYHISYAASSASSTTKTGGNSFSYNLWENDHPLIHKKGPTSQARPFENIALSSITDAQTLSEDKTVAQPITSNVADLKLEPK
ncbi:unnamed protein product [Didymodactylos carnosus]|uniref:Uncharacterized protein n=1 Tax=Didymodactylos carnosus TaxID=1234261 RepID=A0A814B6H7_9BILA|nr:unnamed protein product [Didymodactylos carnosus]CAF0973147.1 unnamed protein product [Didymodactylos carnosus]CAF3702862.1 unnamed protein product [Didymodactylos carnosus]CAF3744376.1 unnamed protein product [Didymodactylos carnosus]